MPPRPITVTSFFDDPLPKHILFCSTQEAENVSEEVFTSLLKRYIMTKDQLEENGYPVKISSSF